MLRKYILLLIIVLLYVYPSEAQENDTVTHEAQANFGLFESDDLLEITLRFDVVTYLRKKPNDDYLKAEMVINPGKPDSIFKKIRLKARGEFRLRECVIPPMELNFKKIDFGYSDLDSIGKIKLVTQCSYGTIDETYILKEYLVYKLFNNLTDTSFRVRLVRVNYIDNERGRKPLHQWGILIEPLDMLTRRTNTTEVKMTSLTQKHIVPFVMDRLALFNYMVGNYDWSIPGQHNVKVVKPAGLFGGNLGIAIPYDFDWTGIVNASYAVPVEETGLDNVRERLFLGICRKPEVFDRHLHLLESHKDEFYSIVNNFAHLRQREREDVIRYLDSFFIMLKGNHNNIMTILRTSCKEF